LIKNYHDILIIMGFLKFVLLFYIYLSILLKVTYILCSSKFKHSVGLFFSKYVILISTTKHIYSFYIMSIYIP